MATPKKKSSAKRAAKSAVRTQTKAAHAAASVAKSTARNNQDYARAGAQWTNRNMADWQSGANEWAKQSAKLYQMPFVSGDMTGAAEQAAASMKSATDNIMRASSDMMQKMFNTSDPMAPFTSMFGQTPSMPSMPSMDDATEKMRSFTRESAEQATRTASGATRTLNEAMELSRENAEAMVECCNTAIAVSKEIGAELISYTNRTFSQNVELGKQLLSCRTLNDMFDLSSKFMKTNLDAFFSESVKLSEKMFQCATDVSEPLNERFSESSDRLSKAIAA